MADSPLIVKSKTFALDVIRQISHSNIAINQDTMQFKHFKEETHESIITRQLFCTGCGG